MVASNEELDTRDAALLDALYDGDGGALDAAQRSTVDDWRAVRGVVRRAREDGFDAEPPSAGTRGSMEMLMAAARAHAPAEPKGAWARLRSWLAPIVAHPAMAGAAALVVIGGAAGVLYLNGQSKVVKPEAAERAAVAPTTPAPTIGQGGDGAGVLEEKQQVFSKEDGVGPGRGEATGAGSAASTVPVPVTATERKPAAAPRGGAGAKPGPEKPADFSARGPVVAGNEGLVAGPTGESGEADDVDKGKANDAPTEGQVEPPPMAAPPPPPTTTETTTETTTVRPAPRPAQIAVDDDAPSAQRTSAVRLTTQARAAAKGGDCARVNVLAKQVESLDAAYYRDVFVRDPDIKKCR